MNKVEETYLYSVMNRGPIKLSRGIEIRSAKSLYLTKEDVLECLKKAHVYRRFANPPGKQELVTTANIDRLHRATYISEADWKKIQANNEESAETEPEVVPEIINKEPSVEEPEEIINPEPETVEEIEEPEEVAELTSAGVRVDEQETSVDEIVDDNIVPDVVAETGEVEESEEIVAGSEEDLDNNVSKNMESEKYVTSQEAESLEEANNETGVSQKSEESQPRTNTVKYDYHKKNKHGNKK